ncbi:MAG: hypothetical protein JSU61_07835, partial [Fidelibacterota bacterium]
MQILSMMNWLSNHLLGLSPVFLLVAIKTTLLLLVTLLILKITPKLSSATRHRIIVMAITGSLALPLLSLALPDWKVIPSWPSTPSIVARAGQITPDADPGRAPLAREAPAVSSATRDATSGAGPTVQKEAQSLSRERAPFHFNWLDLVAVLMGIWLLGIVFILIRIGRAVMITRRQVTEATPITDPNWLALMVDCCRELGVTRSVPIVLHESRTMPTTWGLSNPAIILPQEADHWSDSHKRLVLLHEISHILRWDNGFHLLSLISCTIHWYNPLVWRAYRKLKTERERACDDMVLRAGAEAQSYAEMLLQSVALFKPLTNIVPAMARSTELESRLLAIIDSTRNRKYSRGRKMISIFVALAVLAPIAAADLVETPTVTIESTPLVSTEVPAPPPILSDRIERSFKVKYGEKLILDVSGGPVVINTTKAKEVKILIESRGGEVPESDFEFEQEKGVISVRMRDWDYRDRRWRGRIDYTITVPLEFDLDVSASGGRTEIVDMKGEVFVENSGGRLTLGEVDGNLEARSSGGSLTAGNITGNGDLKSSGGRVRFGDVGGSIKSRSSGGSLTMGNAGGPANLRASGGGIEAGNFDDSVQAETSGGSIRIFNVKGDANLETSGGSITAGIITGEAMAKTSGG